MRIGIDARFFGPESKGLGRYTQKLIEHLENTDQENEYVIFMLSENAHLYMPANSRFTIVIVDARWYTWREQVFFPRVLHQAGCDFVHFPHFNVPIFYKGKSIVTIHDLILLRFPTHRASTHGRLMYAWKFLIYRFVIARAVRRAIHVIAVSAFTRDDVIAHYPHVADKISVTHEAGAEVSKEDTPSEEDQSRYEALEKPYLLYVGNAYPHKNVTAFVNAFDRWRKKRDETMQLVLVGRRDYFYEQIEEYLDAQEITRVVIFDTVSHGFLRLLYRGAHAFVFPSLYEGFGLPPLEACSYGIPVLSSDRSCMPEILGDAVHYVDPEDEEAFVRSIERIVYDDALRTQLRASGPQQAQKYTWQKMTTATRKIYEKMAV